MADDLVKDAHTSLCAAIAELKALGIPVPMALHRAAHSLSYALRPKAVVVVPFPARREE